MCTMYMLTFKRAYVGGIMGGVMGAYNDAYLGAYMGAYKGARVQCAPYMYSSVPGNIT